MDYFANRQCSTGNDHSIMMPAIGEQFRMKTWEILNVVR